MAFLFLVLQGTLARGWGSGAHLICPFPFPVRFTLGGAIQLALCRWGCEHEPERGLLTG